MISSPSPQPVTQCSDERGQISIFFASSLIVLISIIAFVINIGLFVKAKINLQNAVDAAAYAGAAVQSRMLSRVGHLNWEMRNNYKEWLFKYYVLGNLNIAHVENPPAAGPMNFSMLPDTNLTLANRNDIYNFPSVCLHYAGIPTNVCKTYGLPGIPRFESTNLVGIDETTSSFIDAIVQNKADDCSKRSQLNFNVTNMWAYQVMDQDANATFADAPQVAQNRPGAWPKAVEIAIRIRSLEHALNRPPVTGGVCWAQGGGSPAGACSSQVGQLETERHYGNERPLKAFWSAYRNLGNDSDNEMKRSFTLTELSPTAVNFSNLNDTSTLLMSPTRRNEPKYYADFKLQLINYATFFTALISRTSTLSSGAETVTAEGACDVAKIAVPVPGYPLGYYKNPEVLTYYAVKGEASFQGLFNPFAARGVVKLTAYAAAKPIGGRIGPALFRPLSDSDPSQIVTRTTNYNRRSSPYISGIDLNGVPRKDRPGPVPLGTYAPGMPIPINFGTDVDDRFWIGETTDVVGGWVNSGKIVFGIPNLAYDFIGNDFSSNKYNLNNQNTTIIRPAVTGSDHSAGLFNAEQFSLFRSHLTSTDSPEDITRAIKSVRSPTRYEAANYSIPTPSDLHVTRQIDGGYSDNFGFFAGAADSDGVRNYTFYAPLFGETGDAAYKNAGEVVGAFDAFMLAQKPAMEKYLKSMNMVAYSIYSGDPVKYLPAAKRISDFNYSLGPNNPNAVPETCGSIAGQFLFYYYGRNPGGLVPSNIASCPKPLQLSLEEFYNSTGVGTNSFSSHSYTMELALTGDYQANYHKLLTGYMPGPLRGATQNGQLRLPFGGDLETVRRSGYSTKFVTLQSLTRSGGYAPGTGAFAIYSESRTAPLGEDIVPRIFRNALNPTAPLPSTVTH